MLCLGIDGCFHKCQSEIVMYSVALNNDGQEYVMKNQLLLFHAVLALCEPPNMMKYLWRHRPIYVWQLSLYGKTLHS